MRAIEAAGHNHSLQGPTGFGKTVLFALLVKAINIRDSSLVNGVIVPYTPLLANMASRLEKLGFKVGREFKT